MTVLSVNRYKTKYWHRLDDGRVVCDLCPRKCTLRDGKRGVCFIREAYNGEIVLTSYGKTSGFAVDPIEKKPLNHFLPGSSVLSFGTAGCNLACKFCQNWTISKSRELATSSVEASPQEIASLAQLHKCQSVAFTYNDPVIFLEYARDTAIACHEMGIKTVAVSAGYICDEPRKEFFSYMDAANIDLKAFTDRFYKKLCGGQLSPVLDTLLYLKHETKVWFEITTLLIPGENDSSEELNAMTEWIMQNLGPDVPLHFSAFHPSFKMMDTPFTPLSTLLRAREIAMRQGLHYVYTGNIRDVDSESTYCPVCHHSLIMRDRYQITRIDIRDQNDGTKIGVCPHCDTPIPGVFS
ncbi:AmmeMemoRadiSam system radical SAM enzyme [Vibrio albus]|uniref:AmmeMemoRadiSam system radical SAM enzyme n=1 Tax=Vibrio albus TaxID=2200953 RepID=A0A2U3BBB8_9VIBR|nr:AmmeMemoRadiSam system radical SAM enzyme [Vibrio albus]PWI34078.1 AmmeMemoRadiSam system radical SAM enzyme [Vibrio albus]